MKYTLILFGLIFFTSTSCSSSQKQTLEQEVQRDTIWRLTHMNDEKVSFKTTLKFDTHNYFGKAACNNYNGSINLLSATKLSFGKNISTRMACQNLNYEQVYFNKLQTVNHYKIENNILTLYNESNELLLVFTKSL